MFMTNSYQQVSTKSTEKNMTAGVLLGPGVMTRGRRDLIASQLEERRRARFDLLAFSGISSEEKSRLMHALVNFRATASIADMYDCDDDDGADVESRPGDVDVRMLARVVLACMQKSVAPPITIQFSDPLAVLSDIMTDHRNRSISSTVKEFLGGRYEIGRAHV